MMNPKNRSNHKLYIQVLRQLSPEARLLKAFEMTEFTRDLFKAGLRHRFPDLTESDLHKLYLERLDKCHNRNY